ncbi:MAG: S9 family peptidase [Alphaproteobacteria bacterium]|nr:S9 family peptidase [Alphaproteobacteria bacterium]
MNSKKLISLLLLAVFPFFLPAQSRLLTIEDATNLNPRLSPANLSQLQWIPGSTHFAYVTRDAIITGSSEHTVRDTLIRLREMNRMLLSIRQDTLLRFPSLTFRDFTGFYFIHKNHIIGCDLSDHTARVENEWNEKAENIDIFDSTRWVAYTIENALYYSQNGKEVRVVTDPDPAILFGSGRVHRNEFGISKGTFWSPKGNYLAFYRMDERGVASYPLVDITTRIATVKPVKYPMAGSESHKVTLGVMNLRTGAVIYLHTDTVMIPFQKENARTSAPDTIEYLTNVTWSPDEKWIYIAVLNRDQNHMQLNAYDCRTGRLVKTLFEETSQKYVEPMNGPCFIGKDPSRFIWQSRRDGFNHLYLYSSDGTLIKQLTSGPWEVTQLLSPNGSVNSVYFLANREHPIDNQLFSISLTSGQIQLETPEPGIHNPKISDDGLHIIDTYSNLTTPRTIVLKNIRKNKTEILLSAENPLKDYKLGTTTIFTISNRNQIPLYSRLIKPVDFDSTKKYPVIIYVYGGPHSQMVTNSWLGGGGLFLNHLATKGFLVFTLDNRGTSNRGNDFEQAIFRNLGVAELEDQMAGVEYLKSLPYVDSTRIGINGWSYGGFMTLTMMLKNPGTFRVAVCGGPVVDWKYYEIMYGERYMDMPQDNPEGYRNAALINYVKDLTGKVLIIHDDQDETVVPQNSLVFLKKCVDEGKPVDFFLYPGHEHNVRGKDRVHLNKKMVQYFEDYL